MTASNLQIGLNETNQLVSIFDVETGAKCNCICPECGAKLIAKNRNKKLNEPIENGQKIAHFSHANGADCPSAQETAIHLLAKQVLAENKRLLIPSVRKEYIDLTEPMVIDFDKVHTEQVILKDDIKIQPDSILLKGDKELFIEFYKTHLVDDLKIDKIKTVGISCIEIDLNGIEPLKNGKLNIEDVKHLLEEDLHSKTWLYNSLTDELFENFKTKEREKEAKLKKERIEQERIEKEREETNRINNIEKKQRIANRVSKLEKSGYDFLKVYEYVQYDYDSDYNENTGRSKTYKSINSKKENVYCPRDKVKGKNKRIELYECKSCEFHRSIICGDNYEKKIACGFRMKITNTTANKT